MRYLVLNAADSRALTYDNNWNLLAERNLAGQQVGEYIHGSRTDEILRAQFGGNLYYPLTDALGSTVAVTNAAGNLVDRIRYVVYGTPRFLSATYKAKSSLNSGYRFLFTGREWLGQVGLNDHRNRYYSPSLGRWLSMDPIRFLGGANMYGYVHDDSLDCADPFGLLNLTYGAGFDDVDLPIITSIFNDALGSVRGPAFQGADVDVKVSPTSSAYPGISDATSAVNSAGNQWVLYINPKDPALLDPKSRKDMNESGEAPVSPTGNRHDEAVATVAHELGHTPGEKDEKEGGTNVQRNENPVIAQKNIPPRKTYSGFPVKQGPCK